VVALRILKWAGVVLGAGLAILVVLALWPASTAGLASSARPQSDYEQVVAEIANSLG
jgi:hypothetical protein